MAKSKQSQGKARSGGGLSSNKLVTPGLKVGQRRVDAIERGGVSELGAHVGNNPSPLVESRPKAATDLGNYRAEHGPAGPGGGRDVYFTGQPAVGMGPHGPVRQAEHDVRPDPASVRDPNHSFADRPRRRG